MIDKGYDWLVAITRENFKINLLIEDWFGLFDLDIVKVIKFHRWFIVDKHIDSFLSILMHLLNNHFFEDVLRSFTIASDLLNLVKHILVIVQLINVLLGLNYGQILLGFLQLELRLVKRILRVDCFILNLTSDLAMAFLALLLDLIEILGALLECVSDL